MPRNLASLLTLLIALSTAAAGCFEDNPLYGFGDPPFVDLDAVTPTPLVPLERSLDTAPIVVFTVNTLADSGSNTLYARAVFDTGERAVVFSDTTLTPSATPRTIELLLAPCSTEHRIFFEEAFDLSNTSTLSVDIHLVVSDAPFSSNATQALPNSLEGGITSLFATDKLDATRGLTTWNLSLSGSCPSP